MTDFFRHYVWHNLGLKIISLALATALWLAVARDPVAEIAIEVPIEFRNVPSDLEINAEHIPQAQIRLRGPERLVRRLQASDVHPEIDLAGAKPGERTFDLTAQQIHKPYELDVVQVVPGQFHLTFDTKMTRSVQIRPRVLGNFVPGYSISSISVEPATTTITGPRTRVGAVENAITDPVDVSGLMDHGTFVTHAYVPDPLIQVVDPGSIRVTVIMQKTAAEYNAR
jgi:YbbR domain-containing protein